MSLPDPHSSRSTQRLSARPAAPYVAICGPIGVGKSVLGSLLHRHLCGDPHAAGRPEPVFVEEVFAENPFLERLYQPGGIERWGLACEMAFLPARFDAAQQITHLRALGHPVVTDWVVHQNLVYSRLTLNDLEFATYTALFARLMATVPAPDLLVVLDADFDAVARRIRGRGRDMEQSIDPAYLRRLHAAYRTWHTAPPVAARTLVLDTTNLAIPTDPTAQAAAIAEIMQALTLPVLAPQPSTRHRSVGPDPTARLR